MSLSKLFHLLLIQYISRECLLLGNCLLHAKPSPSYTHGGSTLVLHYTYFLLAYVLILYWVAYLHCYNYFSLSWDMSCFTTMCLLITVNITVILILSLITVYTLLYIIFTLMPIVIQCILYLISNNINVLVFLNFFSCSVQIQILICWFLIFSPQWCYLKLP
jgi:hypothetical protein